MIRLTINPKSPNLQSLVFDQPVISIGAGGAPGIDICLSDPNLQALHVKIIEDEERFLAVNVANDPFLSLNGLPFGKKSLKVGDILQIGQVTIQFDELRSSSILALKSPQATPLAPACVPRVVKTLPPHAVAPILEVMEGPQLTQSDQEESIPNNIDDDDYTLSENSEEPIEGPSAFSFWNKKKLLQIFGVFILILAVMGISLFWNQSRESYEDRLVAAEGVADVAMALAYAQINHIMPQKQNWIDPEFLTTNLASILSSEYPSLAYIDNQGQFRNCPYVLRIYTSNDLSQFLVIAQPNPSWWQWIIPQTAIAVDSQGMELHDLDDLRPLNRLVVNASTLDDTSSTEIFQVIQQSPLIPLSQFGKEIGFDAPKALTLIRPGAENRIYNAPRYYHFGESILKKAVGALLVSHNSHEVERIQQQIEELSGYTDLILYSSQGLQKALKAQDALKTLGKDFLVAYLSFNSEGHFASSHLLFSGETHAIEMPLIAMETAFDETSMTSIKPSQAKEHDTEDHHPLLLRLKTIAHDRTQALQAASEPLIALLNRNNATGVLDSADSSKQLLNHYNEINHEWHDKITQHVTTLYHEYAEMSLSQFTSYLQAAGLDELGEEALRKRSQERGAPVMLPPDIISLQLQKIESTKSLKDLNDAVKETADMLKLSKVPDPETLMLYQNMVRAKTIHQLGRFILSPDSPLSNTDFRTENRAVISQILRTAWVTDPEEYEFLLNEFDLRVQGE